MCVWGEGVQALTQNPCSKVIDVGDSVWEKRRKGRQGRVITSNLVSAPTVAWLLSLTDRQTDFPFPSYNEETEAPRGDMTFSRSYSL